MGGVATRTCEESLPEGEMEKDGPPFKSANSLTKRWPKGPETPPENIDISKPFVSSSTSSSPTPENTILTLKGGGPPALTASIHGPS